MQQKLKNKKIQWATYASIDHDIYSVLTHFKKKANFKFLNFLLSPCRTKDKVKRKRGMNQWWE